LHQPDTHHAFEATAAQPHWLAAAARRSDMHPKELMKPTWLAKWCC